MKKTVAIAALVTACTMSVSANAITVLGHTEDTGFVAATSNAPQNPVFDIGTVQFPVGDSANTFRSPWEDLITHAPIAGHDTLQYTSVFNGTAGYNLTGTSLRLFWGSPDTYNSITFWTGINGTGESVVFTGSALTSYPLAAFGSGHDQVQIFLDTIFRSVVLTSTNPAFEFTNLVASCGPNEAGCAPGTTPLPGALPLLASGMFGVGGLLGWRRRRNKAAAPLAA